MIILIFPRLIPVRLDMVPLLEDLLKNPTLIKDMVSFIIGLKGYFERLPFSWDYNDMFDWVAYEDKEIIKEEYTSMWNDVGEFHLQNKGIQRCWKILLVLDRKFSIQKSISTAYE